MHTRLSVNINKIALLRNARGANLPDVVSFAKDCERFGAEGITVHPRPDERHIRYSDIPELKKVVTTEFNIEGNPTETFIELVLKHKPDQVTLVPDEPDALTSDSGWDTKKHLDFLKNVIGVFKSKGIRTSIFLDPDPSMIEDAAKSGVDRIELYTGDYAKHYVADKENAIKAYIETAQKAVDAGLGINAGHDLNLNNLAYLKKRLPGLMEVSIGHALNCDALYFGIENTIQMYLAKLK